MQEGLSIGLNEDENLLVIHLVIVGWVVEHDDVAGS